MEKPEMQWDATSWFHGAAPGWGDLPIPRVWQVHRHPSFHQDQDPEIRANLQNKPGGLPRGSFLGA
ncbi:hypothetical protein CRG98_031402 [Punica granatum]|uniref:Uncharacterized protein n=1 Tax=Punica granatum TaxID=22663 RepID=A0A2I0IW63_PUNGR|nr:hypothetical protein CRG98_031402 [Punica granatum]